MDTLNINTEGNLGYTLLQCLMYILYFQKINSIQFLFLLITCIRTKAEILFCYNIVMKLISKI